VEGKNEVIYCPEKDSGGETGGSCCIEGKYEVVC
jgi:hypothetical protein